MAFNPITYQGLSDLPQIAKGVRNVARGVVEGSKQFKPFFSELSQNAPKIKSFAKDVIEDIKTTGQQYKELQKIKNSTTDPDAIVNRVKDIDDLKDTWKSNSIPNIRDNGDLYDFLQI
jgi:hypothetical protein